MAKKRKKPRGSGPEKRKRPEPPNTPSPQNDDNLPQTGPVKPPEPVFFSPETEQTEHDHTYKFPGVEKVAAHLEASFGNVLKAAADMGVSRTTVYAWLELYPELEAVRDLANKARIEKAESKLMELIEGAKTVRVKRAFGREVERVTETKAPSMQAIQFLLRTIGRERGYILNNQPLQNNDSANLWDQLHEILQAARQEFGDDP